ncbi:TIGR03663 family protein [Candidatus Sumerlaeota bacterium]|nr:TIGR03663 family protein [Candidatus Sumerlaeota bacterium]
MSETSKTFWQELAYYLAVAGVVTLAVWLRFDALDERPMHTDEAVQAAITGILLESGDYEYDATEYHGPVLHLAAAPVFWARGVKKYVAMDEWTLRAVPAAFGVGIVALTLLAGGALGRWPALWAALFTAVSHGLTYYSRYYIHETPLVFFTFAALLSGWKYTASNNRGWALLCGACAALMGATKETAVIVWLAMIAGAAVAIALERRPSVPLEAEDESAGQRTVSPAAMLWRGAPWFLLGFTALWTAAFTMPFTNWGNLPRSLQAYLEYIGRGLADADAHRHPWTFYLERIIYFKNGAGMWFSEAPLALLGALGLLAALRRSWLPKGTSPGLTRALAVMTTLLLLAYSLIPYKTPWCMLGALHGLALLSGIGVCFAARIISPDWRWRLLVWCVALAAAGMLLDQTRLGTTRYAADFRNPYVYAHTSPDLTAMTRLISELSELHSEHERMPMHVISDGPDYWPLPWYLRRYARVGYHSQPPDRADAAIIIVQSELEPDVKQTLRDQYAVSLYGLRPAVFLKLYVRQDLWDAYVREHQRRLREMLEEAQKQ